MLTGFSDEKVVLLLEAHSLWGKRACREILGRKNDFTSLLMDILDEAVTNPKPFISGEKDSHVPAAMLLAQMRVPEVYPRLVSLISYNENDVSALWGDMLTEQYAWMLRDTFNGEAFLLPKLIEDRSVSPWVRATAIRAWSMHYFDGYLSREEIVGCFRHLIRKVYIGEPNGDDRIVLSSIADCIRKHRLEELIDDVKAVYERNGIDTLRCGGCDNYVNEFNNPSHKPEDLHIEDAVRELERGEWFKEEKFRKEKIKSAEKEQEHSKNIETPQEQPLQHTFSKVGRNEPCPCGSGKKYKNCCLGT